VIKARRAGINGTGLVGPRRGRAAALLMALPLLVLSVLLDHGTARAIAPPSGNALDHRGSDMAGTEGKAHFPGRAAPAIVEPLHLKPHFSGDGTPGSHGLAPSTGVQQPSPLPLVEPRRAQYTAPKHWRADARPRAPPLQDA